MPRASCLPHHVFLKLILTCPRGTESSLNAQCDSLWGGFRRTFIVTDFWKWRNKTGWNEQLWGAKNFNQSQFWGWRYRMTVEKIKNEINQRHRWDTLSQRGRLFAATATLCILHIPSTWTTRGLSFRPRTHPNSRAHYPHLVMFLWLHQTARVLGVFTDRSLPTGIQSTSYLCFPVTGFKTRLYRAREGSL